MTIRNQTFFNKPCIISCNECKLYKRYCDGPQNITYSREGTNILRKQLPRIFNIINRFENLEETKVKTPFDGTLSKFIPQIRLNDRRTFYWLLDPSLKEAFNTIMVRFDDVGTSTNLISKLQKYNFPKRIIISTVIPDNKLDILNPNIYITKLNTINHIISKHGYTLIATTTVSYTHLTLPTKA